MNVALCTQSIVAREPTSALHGLDHGNRVSSHQLYCVYAGVNVNPHPPHPGTRWGLVGKRRGFDRNCIPEGVGDWEIFVFNLPQGRGFGWGFVVSQLL